MKVLFNLRRMVNRNRRQIVKILLITIIFLGGIYFLNSYSKQKQEKVLQQQGESTYQYSNIILQFLDYCSTSNESSAYALLSLECKESRYPTIELFIEDYCKVYFSNNVKYTVIYQSNEYKVTIQENKMATGNTKANTSTQILKIIKEGEIQKISIEEF